MTHYDYERQCWIEDDKVAECGHPNRPECGCYAGTHAGDTADDFREPTGALMSTPDPGLSPCSCGWHTDPERASRLHSINCPQRMRWALDAISDCLDGREWDGDACSDIAEVLRANGYTIRDAFELDRR